MNPHANNRRRFLMKATLAVPLLSNLPWNVPITYAMPGEHFLVPDNIHHELFRIYGNQAYSIVDTDRLELKVPDIAENGAVVPISVTGDKGLVSSLALFVAQNPKPLTSTCTLHEGSDLTVSLRIKVATTSDIYLVALTQHGLVGVRKQVKITIGCGGG